MTPDERADLWRLVFGPDATVPPEPRKECDKDGHLWPAKGREITRTLTRFYCRRCGHSRDVDTLNE